MLPSKKHSQREPHAVSAGRTRKNTRVNSDRLVMAALPGEDFSELAMRVKVVRLLEKPEPEGPLGTCRIARAKRRHGLREGELRLCAVRVMGRGRRRDHLRSSNRLCIGGY
jgi:hypothetical protein